MKKGCSRPKAKERKDREIGVAELKRKLGKVLKEVEAGATVVITRRGRPVASLVPPPKTTTPGELLDFLDKWGPLDEEYKEIVRRFISERP